MRISFKVALALLIAIPTFRYAPGSPSMFTHSQDPGHRPDRTAARGRRIEGQELLLRPATAALGLSRW